MNINLQPGEYIVTADYNGLKASNIIKVLNILSASDLTMDYKDGSQFNAKLLDGQGNSFSGQKVTFNINGVIYLKTTNSDGIAKLNINLRPGSYVITSSFNGLNTANTIKISEVYETHQFYTCSMNVPTSASISDTIEIFDGYNVREYIIDYGDSKYELDVAYGSNVPSSSEYIQMLCYYGAKIHAYGGDWVFLDCRDMNSATSNYACVYYYESPCTYVIEGNSLDVLDKLSASFKRT